MTDTSLVTDAHRSRAAVYVRQSTLAQLERNTESTRRQYDLVARARALGWPRNAIRVVDADLGVSGSAAGQRDGFEALVADVALGQVGIILALEVSRLARDNAAWYRLLDLAGVCDTLVADADAVYHPGLFDHRLVLGLKGMMSEAELQMLRARLAGAIRSKAARGELRRGLPAGLVWGDADGEIRFHPDEAVTGAIRAVFGQFAACGSARGVWRWLLEHDLRWPLQQVTTVRAAPPEVRWVKPTYKAVLAALRHPAYAGAYVYGRTRQERYADEHGRLRVRRRDLPPEEWEVLIPGHHEGFISWDTYQDIQRRLAANIPPRPARTAAGRSGKGARCCKPSPPAARAAANARSTTTGRAGPPPATTAPAGRREPAAATGTCGSAGRRSTPPSPPRSWRCSPRPRSRPASPPPGSWNPAMTPHWRNTAGRPNAPATKRPGPNAGTGQSTRRTGWSPADWKPSGNTPCRRRLTRRPNSPGANRPAPPGSPGPSTRHFWPSAATCTRYGTRRRPPTRTASSCCARCWKKSPSPFTATRPRAAPTCCCGGKAARSAS